MNRSFNLWYRIIVFLLFVIMLVGCKTVEQQRQEKVAWLVQKDFMPIDCEKLYPLNLKPDTIYIDTIYGDNQDYSGVIDSLQSQIDNYVQRIQVDSVLQSLSLEACIEEVKRRDSELKKISKDFSELKSKYKPCVPTIVKETKEVYVEDTRLVSQLRNEINSKNAIISEKDKLIVEKDGKLSKKVDDWWKWVAIIEFIIILTAVIVKFAFRKKI